LKGAAGSQISSYADLHDRLIISSPAPILQIQLQNALADPLATFSVLLVDFFKGAGIPCKELFDDATIHFNDIIDLDLITDDGFRSKMFCWAATGSSTLEPDGARIEVYFLNVGVASRN
jgi:hypothetical protein